MLLKEFLNEDRLNDASSKIVNEQAAIIREHYDNDVLTPLISIINSSDSANEKTKAIDELFKPFGGVSSGAAFIAAMLQYLIPPTTQKEFIQLYLVLGATQDKVRQYFANSHYKPHFSADEVEHAITDWKEINKRFIKSGAKFNNIQGFSLTSRDKKTYTGYSGILYFLSNIQEFSPAEVNSFIGFLNKAKQTIDKKFNTKFRDLAKDETTSLM